MTFGQYALCWAVFRRALAHASAMTVERWFLALGAVLWAAMIASVVWRMFL
jgi:hypothetical protein